MKYMSLRIVGLTLLSALLYFLAIPNEIFIYGNGIIGLICLTPVFIGLALSPDKGLPGYIGLIFGIITSVCTYYWLAFFQDFSIWTITGVSLGYALYFLVFFPFLKRFTKCSPLFRPIILAAAWTVFEYFKTAGYLGFPWGLMAYPFASVLPLIQIADITGVWGISFLVVLFQAVLAETVIFFFGIHVPPQIMTRRQQRRGLPVKSRKLKSPLVHPIRKKSPFRRWNWNQWAAVGALTVIFFSYGFYRLGKDIPTKATIEAIMVQQNIDSWLSGNEIESLEIGQNLTRDALAQAEKPIDIVMWSETSFRRPYDEYFDFYEQYPKDDPFTPFLREIDTYLFLGSPHRSPQKGGGYMNAAILLKNGEGILDVYGKQHPVPFAEHVPFWEVEGVRRFFQNVVGLYSAGWTLGKEHTIFSLLLHSGDTVTFGAPICFEDAFPYINRRFILKGADLLINLTNDSWSKQDSSQTQHFLAAYFRTIESRRVLVRSTNSGVSAVVDAYGRILNIMPFFEQSALQCSIPVQKEMQLTVYMRFGDYLPILLMGLLAGVLVVLYVREVRKGVTL